MVVDDDLEILIWTFHFKGQHLLKSVNSHKMLVFVFVNVLDMPAIGVTE